MVYMLNNSKFMVSCNGQVSIFTQYDKAYDYTRKLALTTKKDVTLKMIEK